MSSYDYDNAGNILKFDYADKTDVVYGSYNESNESTSNGLVYDTDGNLIDDALWDYEYDIYNRLVSMEGKGSNIKDLYFTYDYMGRRVKKLYYESGILKDDTRFLYQGRALIAELDGAKTIDKSFHWGPDKSDSIGGAGGAEGLVYMRDWDADDNLYPSYDLNGNLVALLDKAGDIAAWYHYDPNGNVVDSGGTYELDNPIGFSTQYTDRETGLVYYGLRYYSPERGRFLNRDPIAEAGGANLYRFVGNNPVSRVDIWGLNPNHEVGSGEIYNLANFTTKGSGFTPDLQFDLMRLDKLFGDMEGDVGMLTGITVGGGGGGGGGGEGKGDDPDQKDELSDKRCQELAKFIKGRNNLAQNVGNRLADEYQSLTGESSGSLVDAFRTAGSYVGNGAAAITFADEIQSLFPSSGIHMQVGSFTQQIDSGGTRGSWLNNKAGSYVKGAGNAAAAVSFGFNVSDGYQSYQNGDIAGTVNSGGKAAADVMSTYVPWTAPIFMGGNMIDADLKRRMAAFEMNHRLDVFSQDMNSLKSHLNVASGYLNEFQAGGCDGNLLE